MFSSTFTLYINVRLKNVPRDLVKWRGDNRSKTSKSKILKETQEQQEYGFCHWLNYACASRNQVRPDFDESAPVFSVAYQRFEIVVTRDASFGKNPLAVAQVAWLNSSSEQPFTCATSSAISLT